MRITVLHVEHCPHLELARRRLHEAADRLGLTVSVAERLVVEADVPDTAEFSGSPTILVDGRDPFPACTGRVGSACRLYPTPEGLQGAPTVDQLVEALTR